MKNNYTKFLILLLLAFYTPFVLSQDREVLPKGLTETEKGLISEFQFRNTRMTPPPTGPVRAAAEWEEVEYLVVTWQSNFPGNSSSNRCSGSSGM